MFCYVNYRFCPAYISVMLNWVLVNRLHLLLVKLFFLKEEILLPNLCSNLTIVSSSQGQGTYIYMSHANT